MKRQNARKFTLLFALLLLPVTMWYFSPYLIIQSAMEHIANGSLIVFIGMFVVSLFFGRVWCGFLCPTGGLQECAFMVTDKEPKQGWRNNCKYGIWVVWILGIAACWLLGHGVFKVDFFYMTDHGISISSIYNYIIYYGVILLIFLPSVFFGKRTACHYYCWMAPFMIFGGGIGRLLHLPQLHISAKKESCVSCGRCRHACHMSIDVPSFVKKGAVHDAECILCGACADACPNKVLHFTMKKEKKQAE